MLFDEFLAHIRKPSNYVLTRYFKSFMTEFGKKEWKRSNHYRIISDFLQFITEKTVVAFQQQQIIQSSAGTDSIPNTDDDEFDIAGVRNEVYKFWNTLVQQKLYDKLFGLPSERLLNSAIQEKCNIMSQFLQLSHFTIAQFKLTENIFQIISYEFEKMNSLKTTCDKLIHIVNGCKILLSFLSQASSSEQQVGSDLISFSDENDNDANQNRSSSQTITIDEYLPVLIFILVKNYPSQLYLNCLYIDTLDPELTGETAYYFTNVMSALHFIQNLDKTKLNLDPYWFDLQIGIYTKLPSSQLKEDYIQSSRDSTIHPLSKTPSGISNVFGFLSKYVPSTTTASTFMTASSNGDAGNSSPVPTRPLYSLITRLSSGSAASIQTTKKDDVFNHPSVDDEEDFQLQLAMALSLSEQEHAKTTSLLPDEE